MCVSHFYPVRCRFGLHSPDRVIDSAGQFFLVDAMANFNFVLPQKLPDENADAVERSKLRKFLMSDVSDLRLIGSGTFGDVSRGRYMGEDIVVKKLKPIDRKCRPRLVKEATIIEKCSNSPNIVSFVGVCSSPIAMMLRYEEFAFKAFRGRQCCRFFKLLIIVKNHRASTQN